MRIGCLVSLLVAAMLALGCRQGSSGPKAIVYAQAEDPKTLDPINTDIAEAVHVMTNVFDTLVTYDERTTEIVPSLAERWETSEEGRKWTFHLRPGVTFHDGEPLNAAAVKFTFERLLSEKHPQVYDAARPYRSAYLMIDSIEAPDDATVVFHLKHPSAIFLPNLAMFSASIVSPQALKEAGPDFAERPIGTGPFRVVRWMRDQQLVLDRFDEHWRGPAKAERLIFVPVKENATRAQRLVRGEVHIADGLSPIELESLARQPNLRVAEQLGMNVAYLTMQTEKPPLNHQKVREAIWLAIDKQRLIEVGYSGHAEPAATMVPPAMWGHDDEIVDRKHDPRRARQLLEEAAKEHGFSLPVRLKLSVMNQARLYLPQPEPIAGYLKEALGDIGIEVSLVQRDVNQHFEHLMAGQHELGLAGWNTDNSDPDNFLYTLLDSDNIGEHENNLSRWRNDKYHELMLAGQRETDQAERFEIYRQAQRIVFEECPVVPLVHTKMRVAMAKRLKGYELHPTGLVRLRTAHLEESP